MVARQVAVSSLRAKDNAYQVGLKLESHDARPIPPFASSLGASPFTLKRDPVHFASTWATIECESVIHAYCDVYSCIP